MTTTVAPPEATEPQLRWVTPASIAPNERNPRGDDLGNLTDLIASIRAQSILEPLVVQPHPMPKGKVEWLLIMGHRRLAAAKQAKLKQVPVIVQEETDEIGQRERMLVENLQRKDLTVLQEGDAYQALLDLGLTQKDISTRVGRSRKVISERVRVASLPEQTRDRILSQQVDLDDAVQMAAYAGDPDTMKSLDDAAQQGHWALQTALTKAKLRKERERQRAETLKAGKRFRTTVLTDDPDPNQDDPDVIDEELLRDVKWEHLVEAALAKSGETHLDGGEVEKALEVELDEWMTEHRSTCVGSVIYDDGDTAAWLCVAFEEKHPDLAGTTATPNPTKAGADLSDDPQERARQEAEARERAEKQRRRAELQLELTAAARTRRAWIGEVIRGDTAEGLAKQGLLRNLARYTKATGSAGVSREQTYLAQILLPDLSDEALANDLPGKLKKALEKLSAAQLRLVTVALNYFSADEQLDQPDAYMWSDRNGWSKNWRDELRDTFGYEPTDVEQRMVAEANGDES